MTHLSNITFPVDWYEFLVKLNSFNKVKLIGMSFNKGKSIGMNEPGVTFEFNTYQYNSAVPAWFIMPDSQPHLY